jgi:hypothetical protein
MLHFIKIIHLKYTDGRISIVVYTKCLWEQISQTAQHDIKKRKQNGAEED